MSRKLCFSFIIGYGLPKYAIRKKSATHYIRTLVRPIRKLVLRPIVSNMLTTLALIRTPSIWWVQCGSIRDLPARYVTGAVLQRYRSLYGTCLWCLMQVHEWPFSHSDKSEAMNKLGVEVAVNLLWICLFDSMKCCLLGNHGGAVREKLNVHCSS